MTIFKVTYKLLNKQFPSAVWYKIYQWEVLIKSHYYCGSMSNPLCGSWQHNHFSIQAAHGALFTAAAAEEIHRHNRVQKNNQFDSHDEGSPSQYKCPAEYSLDTQMFLFRILSGASVQSMMNLSKPFIVLLFIIKIQEISSDLLL